MGRMHAPGKGISQSSLPYRRSVPTAKLQIVMDGNDENDEARIKADQKQVILNAAAKVRILLKEKKDLILKIEEKLSKEREIDREEIEKILGKKIPSTIKSLWEQDVPKEENDLLPDK